MKRSNGSTERSRSGSATGKATCKDCALYWMCLERSRMYPCVEFKHKEKDKGGNK